MFKSYIDLNVCCHSHFALHSVSFTAAKFFCSHYSDFVIMDLCKLHFTMGQVKFLLLPISYPLVSYIMTLDFDPFLKKLSPYHNFCAGFLVGFLNKENHAINSVG